MLVTGGKSRAARAAMRNSNDFDGLRAAVDRDASQLLAWLAPM
jgi:hypothetical protein